MRDLRRIPLEEATEKLLGVVAPLEPSETVPLAEATGRVAYADIAANVDVPPFNRSPLDGYAVDHRDLAEAERDRPARLHLVGRIFAGEVWDGAVERGCAVGVATGAPIPAGATCVVRQEDADEDGDAVSVRVALGQHDNYCFCGEDARSGFVLVRQGERVTPGHIGLLASQGRVDVEVFRRPRVGILSTGSELIPLGGCPGPGQIFDSNGAFLAALCAETGAVVAGTHCGADDPDQLAEIIVRLLEQSDVVIATGGVSVGRHDYMPEVGAAIGARTLFHGVAIRPGSPALALLSAGKPILCLSGNPYAAFVTFHLLAAPALRRLGGVALPCPERLDATLSEAFPKGSDVRRLVPAWLSGGRVSFPSGGRASRALVSLTRCNCLIDIPGATPPMDAGRAVEVLAL